MSHFGIERWGMAAALALSTGLVAVGTALAAATPPSDRPLYAGGATFPELEYRKLQNCYGNDSSANPPAMTPAAPAVPAVCATPKNPHVWVHYSGVGSGNGKKAFRFNNPSKLTDGGRVPDASPVGDSGKWGPFFGTTPGAHSWPGLNDPYPHFNFAGSDDPLIPSDITDYNTTSGGQWGAPLQFPAMVGGVTMAFNPLAVWTEAGKPVINPGTATSAVNLSRDTWCGIFGGAITNWNDPHITGAAGHDNEGTVLGNGPIVVVVRSDGSGTTFLFTNGLINQCGSTTNPKTTDPAMAIPDQWFTDNGIPNAPGTTTFNSNNNFYINVKNAGHLPLATPGNPGFDPKPGNGGIQAEINAVSGAIGYLTADRAKPVDPAGPKTANPQTWYSVTKPTKPVDYITITPDAVTRIMQKVKAPLFTCSGSGCFDDPLAWGKAEPNPTDKNAYPVGGFTFMDTYTCHARQDDVDALVGSKGTNMGYLKWYYGSGANSVVKVVLQNDGFAPIPGPWKSAVTKLLFKTASTRIDVAGGTLNPSCTTVTGVNP
jgi:phosphate transport system substrate-binding protein